MFCKSFLFVLLLMPSILLAEEFNETNDFPTTNFNPPVTLVPGDWVNGSIDVDGDRDMIRIDVPANTSFGIAVSSNTQGLDIRASIYTRNGNDYTYQGWSYDVGGFTPSSFTLNGGNNGTTFYAQVRRYTGNDGNGDSAIGNYRLHYSDLSAINTRDFTKVRIEDVDDLNIFGSALLIGNQLLCRNNADGGACLAPNLGATNNAIDQHKVRIDPNGPANNSMAKLVLEPGDEVVWAGLYWSARIASNSVEHPNAAQIQLRTPAGGYNAIQSDPNKFNWFSDGNVFDYACMQEVTDLVKAGGAGEYFAGGIEASNGTNRFAAWALLVIVENNSRSFKNISVYDGFEAVYDASDDYPDEVNVVADGFLTPKTGDVTASLFVFSGESESGIDDGATITDKDGIEHTVVDAYNNQDDVFNGSATIRGEHRSNHADPNIANPNFQNLIGSDIDILEIEDLSNFQTSTTITIESKNGGNSDRYTLNMFAIETELFTPRFCYDYAYEQDGVDFTEENDGTENPDIVGTVSTSSPVDVKIYLKNLVDSDITITDLKLNILNIDTAQVQYKTNSTYLTPVGGVFPYHVSDSILDTTDASKVLNIPVGDMASNDHIYLYYSLNPQQSTLNTPLLVEAEYTLTIGNESIPYATRIGERIEMCSDDNFNYEPTKGIFSVVDNNYYNYDVGGSQKFYNLPTQVVNRRGNFKLVSFDPDNLDEPKPISTIVAIELLDVSGFHDIEHTCTEENAGVGGRSWVILDNQSSVDLQALFPIASKNATYRISYNNMNPYDDDIVQTELLPDGNYKMLNFPYLAGDPCVRPTEYPLGAGGNYGIATQVSQACGNAGNQGISKEHLDACMECIYGLDTKFICSRDNFSIRPEAFDMQLRDTNQVQNAANGLAIPNNADLAAGYGYDVAITAVTHTNNNPSTGYTTEYNEMTNDIDANGNPTIRQTTFETDTFHGFDWRPGATNIAGCNNTNDQSVSINFNNGSANILVNLSEVGIYQYLTYDRTWTTADQLPSHHTGTYFTGDFDCLGDQSLVQTQVANTVDMAPNNYNRFLNGCDISSNHQNVDTRTIYRDYTTEFHPYQFNVNSIVASAGLNNIPLPANGGFVYMADVGDNTNVQNRNISVHLNGAIIAEGADGTALSNFVNQCFAQPLFIDLTSMAYTPLIDANGNNVNYQFRLITRDDQTVQLRDTQAIVYDPQIAFVPTDPNDPIPQLATTDFVQNAQGSADTILLLNYDRAINVAANPTAITYNNYVVNCTTAANCTFIADMNTNATTTGTNNLNTTVNHYYARSFTPRQSYTALVGNAPIFYETYCDVNNGCNPALLQGTDVSKGGDTRWRLNPNHIANNGTAGNVVQKTALVTVTANPLATTGAYAENIQLTYNNTRGRPYTAIMQHIADPWLVYDPYNVAGTTNEFEAEFIGGNANWAGKSKTENNTETDAAQRSNRKLVW